MRAAPRGMLSVLLVLVLALGMHGLPGAGAAEQEEACLQPVLALQEPPAAFAPGATETLAFIIENPNGEPVTSVDARIQVDAPNGWRAVAATSRITYTGSNATPTSLSITAPDRGAGDAAGVVVATVTFTCTRGSVVTEPVQASLPVDVQVAPSQPAWLLLSGVTFTALLVFTGVWAVRGRAGPIHATCRERSKAVRPGRGESYPLVVLNRSSAPDLVRFEVTGIPDGWTAHVALPEIELEAREERTLWLRVRPPERAEPGQEARVTVRAASTRRPDEGASVTVRAKVEA